MWPNLDVSLDSRRPSLKRTARNGKTPRLDTRRRPKACSPLPGRGRPCWTTGHGRTGRRGWQAQGLPQESRRRHTPDLPRPRLPSWCAKGGGATVGPVSTDMTRSMGCTEHRLRQHQAIASRRATPKTERAARCAWSRGNNAVTPYLDRPAFMHIQTPHLPSPQSKSRVSQQNHSRPRSYTTFCLTRAPLETNPTPRTRSRTRKSIPQTPRFQVDRKSYRRFKVCAQMLRGG